MTDFAANITSAPGRRAGAVSTEGILIRHHKTGATEVSFAVPSGGHLLHLAATCVSNDLRTAAAAHCIALTRVDVCSDGDFDEALTRSTGVALDVEAEGTAPPEGDPAA
ncbi:hypothetical protein RBS60_00360 [Sinomonas sp. ASV486]|uniref:hypothetical protein n=1 Tax=Sinomonas sp. ASV486 TaxID=3051170 RepID=UPI0027DC579D|nr:hypothetical protein [Sinomonas sp. ASV486]MDQ4488645.1 hypothetical protein [Sinomonas sp. ASV486]